MSRFPRMRFGWFVVAVALLGAAPAWSALCRKRSGALLQRDVCKKGETTVDPASLGLVGPSGLAGPAGADGADGAPGPTGPAGPAGPSAIVRKTFPTLTLQSNTFVAIAALQVPVGAHLLMAQAWFANTDTDVGGDGCDCHFTGENGLTGDVSVTLAAYPSGAFAIPVSASTIVSGPATITWECRNGQGAGGGVAVRNGSLTAIQTGSVSEQ